MGGERGDGKLDEDEDEESLVRRVKFLHFLKFGEEREKCRQVMATELGIGARAA